MLLENKRFGLDSSKLLCSFGLKLRRSPRQHVFPPPKHVYVSRLLQAEENRTSVETEIKNSICSLIAEMNKKGQMLLNQLEVQKPVSIKHPAICEKSNIRIFSSHAAALCTSSLICRQRCLFCPQAPSEHPQAQWILQMLASSTLSECNKGSREGFAKTAGGHRLSVQTPGSRHRLHQVGQRQEQGHGLPAL